MCMGQAEVPARSGIATGFGADAAAGHRPGQQATTSH